jgi:hypothetical protein
MSQATTSFPDSTYSSSNKPSTTTLKADIQALETAHNETDTYAIRKDGTVAMAADLPMGGNQVTNVGTPSASTDAATLAAVQAMWPIGSVFTSVVATNPNSLLGFGTWSAIAAGKMLIGLDSGDATMDTAEETGGAKTVTIGQTNLPNISTGAGTAHTHTQDAHTHTVPGLSTGGSGGARIDASTGITVATNSTVATNQNESAHTHSLGGSGTALNVMNPFFVVYFFKRTA